MSVRTRSSIESTILLAIAVIAGCAPATSAGANPTASHEPSEPLDCATAGYACSWSDVSPEIAERSRALAREAAGLVDGGATSAAAGWLEGQEDVTSVSEGDGVIRFVLEGGRPVWVSVGSKGAEVATAAHLDGLLASAGDARPGRLSAAAPRPSADPTTAPPPGSSSARGVRRRRRSCSLRSGSGRRWTPARSPPSSVTPAATRPT